jgi:uncharacterized protein YgiB involved in biofilm formation
MRRRSRFITLTLVTSTTLVLGGCGDEPLESAGFYQNKQECITRTGYPELCEASQQDALKQHLETAPRYTSREECIEQHGAENCMEYRQDATGNSWFMPLMAGYILGRYAPSLWTGNVRYGTQSACRDGSGNVYTGECRRGGTGGVMIGRLAGGAFAPSDAYRQQWTAPPQSKFRKMVMAPKQAAHPSVARRGGFGLRGGFAG